MTMRGLQVYRCLVCDSVVEVLDSCGVELVCCGPPMELLPEQAAPVGRDQHAVRVRKTARGLHVVVGNPLHPSEAEDRIAWIETLADGCCFRRFLAPGQRPEAMFNTAANNFTVRYYCIRHGLWSWSQGTARGVAADRLPQCAGSVL